VSTICRALSAVHGWNRRISAWIAAHS